MMSQHEDEQMERLGQELGPAKAVYTQMIRTRITVLCVVGLAVCIFMGAYIYQNWADQQIRDCRVYVQGNYLATIGEAVAEVPDISPEKEAEFRAYLGDEGVMRNLTTTCPTFFWPWNYLDTTPPLPSDDSESA